jgi:HEPN domain-containing protein
MKPPDAVVHRLTRGWLVKAKIDVLVCEQLLPRGSEFHEAVAFHAQHAAEKALKAYLVWRQVEFPKTHDIERLLELTASVDTQLAEATSDAAELTPFGVEYRYPGEYPPVSAEAAGRSVALARRVHDGIVNRLPDELRR